MLKAFIVLVALIGLLSGCTDSQQPGGLRGLSASETDDLNSGRQAFDSSDDPDISPATFYAAGQLAESNGNMAAAFRQYHAAVHKDRNFAPAWYRLGTLYAQHEQFPKAIEAWENYARVSGNNATAYSNLGFCYELAGKLLEAERAYRKGISIDPRNEACRVNYGLMLARHGHFAQAQVQMQAVLSPAQVHYNFGSVHEAQGRAAAAVREYRNALNLDPGFAAARHRLEKLEATQAARGNPTTAPAQAAIE